jgi:hypothetical protein
MGSEQASGSNTWRWSLLWLRIWGFQGDMNVDGGWSYGFLRSVVLWLYTIVSNILPSCVCHCDCRTIYEHCVTKHERLEIICDWRVVRFSRRRVWRWLSSGMLPEWSGRRGIALIKAVSTSNTSVNFCQTTRFKITEDSYLLSVIDYTYYIKWISD